MKTISVVIPTYNRPSALARCLASLLQAPVEEIIVVDDSHPKVRDMNRHLIESANGNHRPLIRHITHNMRTSAPTARNRGIDVAKGDIILLIDDDMVVACGSVFGALCKIFEAYPTVGIVCGRIVEAGEKIVDPPFYLNLFLADHFSRLTGFVFQNVGSDVRFAEFATPIMAVRREALNGVRYDERFKGTHYREETDIQHQCKRRGWKILFFPMLTVMHYGSAQGGGRGQGLKERVYWKARNHTLYVKKHFQHLGRCWYYFAGLLILLFYRPMCLGAILKGFRDGQASL